MANIENRINQGGVKVIKIKDYNVDMFYDEKSDNYFMDEESMKEHYEDNISDTPRYVYGCVFETIKIDLDRILEDAVEEHHEDAMDSIDGISELRKAIDEFNDCNKSNGSYYDDIALIIDLQ